MRATDGQTIAIPALGTGIYSVPHDVSAKSLVTATNEFLQENPSHALKEVHFVDNDPTAIEALMKEMSSRFRHDMNFQINDLVRDRWRSFLEAANVTPPTASRVSIGDNTFETPEGMEIRLTIGNIAKSTVRYSNPIAVKHLKGSPPCCAKHTSKCGETREQCFQFLSMFPDGGKTRKQYVWPCFLKVVKPGNIICYLCFLKKQEI